MRHLLLPLALALLLLLGAGTTSAVAKSKPAPAEVFALLKELRAELERPGLTVAEAAKNLGSPKAALAFVRDEVAYAPYAGAWHGAEGTLRARVANSADQATLLRDLLAAMKVEARLVRADLPKGATPHRAKGSAKRPAALAKLQALLGVERRAYDPAPSKALVARLSQEVQGAYASLRRVLAGLGEAARLEGTSNGSDAALAPRDRVWVQAKLDGKTFVDLDPVYPHVAHPADATAYVPAAIQTTVELLADETSLVTWTGTSSEILGHDAQIQLLPASGKLKDAETPRNVRQWVPLLRVGAKSVGGKPFAPGGKTIAPKPAVKGLFGSKPAQPGQVGAKSLRLRVRFAGEGQPDRSYDRVVQRFDAGFDPQQLVAHYRMTLGVADVPLHVTTARVIDEMLDAHTLATPPAKDAEKGSTSANGSRGLSGRSARVLNALFFLQPALVSKGLQLEWTGPAVVVESVSLRTQGDALKSVARIDIWHQAFAPAAGSPRALRAEWGLATLAVEGHLLDTSSVNHLILSSHGPVVKIAEADAATRLRGDEIAQGVLADGGIVLSSTTTHGVTWSLRPSGELLGTITARGTAAKGGQRMNDAIAAGVGGVAGGMAAATGNPAGMLVGGIASYLNELRKAYEAAAGVLDAVADTIATGDDRYVLEAIGAYDPDFARRLTRALAEGAARGWAESVIGAGVRPLLPASGNPYGPTLGDRFIDGALAGGLAAPQDLPGVTDVVSAAGGALFRR